MSSIVFAFSKSQIWLCFWTIGKSELVWFQSHFQSELVDCTLHWYLFCWMFKLEFLHSLKEHLARLPWWRLMCLPRRDLQVAQVSAPFIFILRLPAVAVYFAGLRGCFYPSAISLLSRFHVLQIFDSHLLTRQPSLLPKGLSTSPLGLFFRIPVFPLERWFKFFSRKSLRLSPHLRD